MSTGAVMSVLTKPATVLELHKFKPVLDTVLRKVERVLSILVDLRNVTWTRVRVQVQASDLPKLKS